LSYRGMVLSAENCSRGDWKRPAQNAGRSYSSALRSWVAWPGCRAAPSSGSCRRTRCGSLCGCASHGTPSSAGTKLYGGQGPVSSSSTPLSRYSAASSPTSC